MESVQDVFKLIGSFPKLTSNLKDTSSFFQNNIDNSEISLIPISINSALQKTLVDGIWNGINNTESINVFNHMFCRNLGYWGPISTNRLLDFTVCFEYGLLSLIPYFILFIFGSYNIYAVSKKPAPSVPFGTLYLFKIVLTLMASIFHLIFIVMQYIYGSALIDSIAGNLYMYVSLIGLLYALIISHYEHMRSRMCSTPLIFSWLSQVIIQFFILRTVYLDSKFSTDSIIVIYHGSMLIISLIIFVLENIPKEAFFYSSLDADTILMSPEMTASIWSRLVFSWMTPLMKLGHEKHLEIEDLWSLNPDDRASYTGEQFQTNWENELTKPKPSIFRVIVKTYGAHFCSAAIFKVCQDLCAFILPQLLKLMVQFAVSWGDLNNQNEKQPVSIGFAIAFAMVSVAVIQTLMLHQYFQICVVSGLRISAAVSSSVYKKSLTLSNGSRQSSTSGEIVNLMSVDSMKMGELTTYLHILWSGPFQIFMAIYFLYQTLGFAIFAGIAVMILMIPINIMLASTNKTFYIKQMKNKDNRTKIMDEILNGIKVIKLYAWEVTMRKKVNEARDAELQMLKKIGFLQAAQTFSWIATPFLVSFSSFACYSLIGNEPLTSSKVFVCIALFNLLQFPLNVFPNVITSCIEASVSMKRLNKFLLNEELNVRAISHDAPQFHPPSGIAPRVVVENASFGWYKNGNTLLNDINITVYPEKTSVIIGSVGSGKSSLMSALLGEMYKKQGLVAVRGTVAYCPQTAWIMNSTLRDNILFGKPYDENWYNQVIYACGLTQDINMLPGGDLVEIGEKGINLSGGQKQRVSLARAVYSDADVYLLDDVLSAVDAHVGKHIFDNVIGNNGILRKKAKLLVTHAIQYLHNVNQIYYMERGEITQSGNYDELMADVNGPLHRLVMDTGTSSGNDDYDDNIDEYVVDNNNSVNDNGKSTELDSEIIKGDRNINNKTSKLSTTEVEMVVGQKLISKEDVVQGSVSWDVYKLYAKACSYKSVSLFFFLAMFSQVLNILQNLYLADWASENDYPDPNRKHVSIALRLTIYGLLGLSNIVSMIFQVLIVWVICGLHASKMMHTQMLNTVLRLPQSFFDTTPMGRILNRFSRDQYLLDEILPRTFQSFIRTLFAVVSVVIVNTVGAPLFIVCVIPLAYLYREVQEYYLSSSRELKRLSSVTRSPIYAQFSETLAGASTIRAFKQNIRFIEANEMLIDANNQVVFASKTSNRWLAVRLEFLGAGVVFGSALFSVITITFGWHIAASIVGLMLTYSTSVTQSLNWMVRQSCEIETNIVCVERIKEYIDLPREAHYKLPENTPSDSWPEKGVISFNDYSTRYRPELDLVLKNISLDIKSTEKVGIVGRTGAGKSSLTLALFRLIEASSGNITIDGIDISTLGLLDLRSRITIIPQDPVLFNGTIRSNLTTELKSDADLWLSLERAGLKSFVSALPGQLDAAVLPNGENLSVGQRQLICLARALLRKTKVLVLDEATASVDYESDALIQRTIRTEFAHCTVLCIAHRLATVMDYDRILVLDKGEVAEFDSPTTLLRQKDTIFFKLARESRLV